MDKSQTDAVLQAYREQGTRAAVAMIFDIVSAEVSLEADELGLRNYGYDPVAAKMAFLDQFKDRETCPRRTI